MATAEEGGRPLVAILADDLTGAADAAAPFAARGLATAVVVGDDALAQVAPTFPSPAEAGDERAGAAARCSDRASRSDAPEVVARFSGGRDLPEAEAVRRTRDAVERLRAAGEPGHWYLKIDSVLRGHPGAELAAAMATLGVKRALVAPALPSQGRAVEGGRLRAAGTGPGSGVAAFGGDEAPTIGARFRDRGLGPISRLRLREIEAGPAAIAARLGKVDRGAIVADARTEAHLDRLVQAALGGPPLLLCGSAGLAGALARAIAGEGGAPGRSPVRRPAASRPILVVAGSYHPATARQIAKLAAAGARVVEPPRLVPGEGEPALAALAAEVAAGLAAGQTTVLTAVGCPEVRLDGAAIADLLARIAARPATLGAAGGVVATGGEVAAALFRAAGASRLCLGGEVRPAIPWGILAGGLAEGLPAVTKAGSFGDDDTLAACVAFLRGAAD